MTNLEKLEAKIKELVPEIMELKPGCRIQWCQIIGIVAGFDICKCKWQFYNESNNIVPFDEKPEDGEILGRPITLEDVLYTVVNYPYKNWIWRDRATDKVLENWELLKPLSDQPEETITNLLKIFEV